MAIVIGILKFKLPITIIGMVKPLIALPTGASILTPVLLRALGIHIRALGFRRAANVLPIHESSVVVTYPGISCSELTIRLC